MGTGSDQSYESKKIVVYLYIFQNLIFGIFLQNYIARFGHGSAKLARQAQSKEKTLAKMVASGLTEKVVTDKVLNFYFPSCGKIPPPVIMVQNVSFRYTDKGPWIYRNLEFGIDLDTRLALVGPNGAGKSTLLKLLYGEVGFLLLQ